MKLSRRTLVITAATLALVLAASAGIYARIRTGADADGAGGEPKDALPATSAAEGFSTDVAIPVEGAPAVRDTLVLAVSAAGQAEGWKKAVVVAQVTGRIASLPVRENQAVGSGQLLAALDAAEYGLAVEEAEAALRQAQASYREGILLNEEIPDERVRRDREAFARSKSGLDAAEVRLRKARLDLSRTRVGAPFAGRVASLKVVPGQWVRAGDELMTIVALDPIKVEVQVLESEVGLLAPGRRAQVRFAAFPQAFTGTVQTINPVVESGTRTARVTVTVPNPGGRILPGMYARVSLEAQRFADRVLVPRSALLERDGRPMLFVFEGEGDRGLAKWRYVTPGRQNDSLVEILPSEETDSVRPGERVLTAGHLTLIHDARVRLVDDVKDAGGRPQ
ncbi:MAG TPA: efflux RND transporter periplasmic adaptor subunit [Longimicrobiaceae bacterium]|nr:efflux RND transporter periplasmic adaptor subunit [Longimicrobiaceae bacterium]